MKQLIVLVKDDRSYDMIQKLVSLNQLNVVFYNDYDSAINEINVMKLIDSNIDYIFSNTEYKHLIDPSELESIKEFTYIEYGNLLNGSRSISDIISTPDLIKGWAEYRKNKLLGLIESLTNGESITSSKNTIIPPEPKSNFKIEKRIVKQNEYDEFGLVVSNNIDDKELDKSIEKEISKIKGRDALIPVLNKEI